jgi:conjugative transfer region lipoprotein (TIGR03751 family)
MEDKKDNSSMAKSEVSAGGLTLSGCSSLMSSKMPAGSLSMQRAYNGAIDGANDSTGVSTLNQVRNKMGRLRARSANYNGYTRTQQNEIDSQFPQLPNPSIVMYVYPHEAGRDYNLTPVPGYSTVFPLYQHPLLKEWQSLMLDWRFRIVIFKIY